MLRAASPRPPCTCRWSRSLAGAAHAAVSPPPAVLSVDAAVRTALDARFVIPPAAVEALRSSTGLSDDELLLAVLAPTLAAARPPTSRFCVAASVLGASGAIYLGVNVETAAAPLGFAVHAEQFALATARAAHEKGVVSLAASASPCGHCRQYMQELPGAGGLRVLVPGRPPTPLADLLPSAFGPADLATQGVKPPLFLGLRHAGVALDRAGRNRVAELRSEAASDAALVEGIYAAMAAANGCHAPYSRTPAGCALVSPTGRVSAAGTAESAAFNPTLSPLQAAVIAAIGAAPRGEASWAGGGGEGGSGDGGAGWRCVLAQLGTANGGLIDHEAATRAMLGAVAPRATLEVITLASNTAARDD